VLLSLLGRGIAPEVARTAARELLSLDDKTSEDSEMAGETDGRKANGSA
jgi:hypothetical protein